MNEQLSNKKNYPNAGFPQAPYSGSQCANPNKGLGFILSNSCFADSALL